MRPNQILLRCFAEREDGMWVAYCLDLSLVAQAKSFDDAKLKLDAQIREYVADALIGPDRKHAQYLLSRRAPASLWLHYYWTRFRIGIARRLHAARNGNEKIFKEVLPVQPVNC